LAKSFTLGKKERLKSRKLIEQLFKEGKSFAVNPFRIYVLTGDSPTTEIKFGVGVSTKNFKKAVDRNRIKRLVREAYRLQKNELQQNLQGKNIQLSLFFIYTAKDLPVYKDVYDKMKIALQKINKQFNES
jgi:ribonuclease P protein component